MAGKRGKGRFLHLGHPGVVISGKQVWDPISGSGQFKGPWMGISAGPVKGPFFEGPKTAKSAAMGDYIGFFGKSVKKWVKKCHF